VRCCAPSPVVPLRHSIRTWPRGTTRREARRLICLTVAAAFVSMPKHSLRRTRKQIPMGRFSGSLCAGQGNSVLPIKNRSHSRAAPRPSLIAQTTRLWPRRMSPAVKTRGTLVWNLPCSALAIGTRVLLHPELIEHRGFRPKEAHRQEHKLGREHSLRTRNLPWREAAVVFDPLHVDRVQRLDAAVGVTPRTAWWR